MLEGKKRMEGTTPEIKDPSAENRAHVRVLRNSSFCSRTNTYSMFKCLQSTFYILFSAGPAEEDMLCSPTGLVVKIRLVQSWL